MTSSRSHKGGKGEKNIGTQCIHRQKDEGGVVKRFKKRVSGLQTNFCFYFTRVGKHLSLNLRGIHISYKVS